VRNDEVQVSIRDTGAGLPPELVGKLFTPFATTKPHGLGIGLAIARSIVEAHDGRIDARNHPEGGAIFTVTLGVCREPAPAPAPAPH
jgi:two-component system sensor kinase FixL